MPGPWCGTTPTASASSGEDARAPLEMGTLSKTLGSYGGYLCASRAVVDLMTSRARSFVYTTGLPPASAAAALAALDIVEAEPDFAARPLALARRFTAQLGLPEAQSPIVPILVGEADAALGLSARFGGTGLSRGRHPPANGPGRDRRGCEWRSPPRIRRRRWRGWPTR